MKIRLNYDFLVSEFNAGTSIVAVYIVLLVVLIEEWVDWYMV
jgi:hypothetical protein